LGRTWSAVVVSPSVFFIDCIIRVRRYETTNHLWLILEYCVGGDLDKILKQDMRLPESSVHDFGRDLLAAMQHLHSKGIIHCDLKPSNVLLDENGAIKLGGFSVARRLSDISSVPVANIAPVRLGPRRLWVRVEKL
jgi:serine/threonine-protein kinase ULK4